MKKVLPIFILLIGILVVIGAFLLVKSKNSKKEDVQEPDSEEVLPEIALEKRPVVSLMPSADGHWLKLKIQKILIDAATLDYEMTYKVPDGRTQGVPGTVKLTTKDDIEKDLLLGSESSGKFRYDEGVESGQLVFRFRDSSGKLVAKFQTEFNLLTSTKDITSTDGVFKLTFEKIYPKTFFIVINTIGYPGDVKLEESTKLYGLFSSEKGKYKGSVEITGSSYITYWDGLNWNSKLESIESGVFAGS
jgi:hypothetical protein